MGAVFERGIVVWRIEALEAPWVERRCARCGGPERFRSSGCFRVNANGRRLDIWLIYNCGRCALRWNLPLYERCAPERLPGELYAGFLRNDPALAWRCAFDREVLARAGAEAALQVPYRVLRSEAPGEGPLRLRLSLREPLSLRLDRLLAAELGAPRGALLRLAAEGALGLGGDPARVLRRRITDGQEISLSGEAASLARRREALDI